MSDSNTVDDADYLRSFGSDKVFGTRYHRLLEIADRLERLEQTQRFQAACAALTGMLARGVESTAEPTMADRVKIAVRYADALLAELAEEKDDG